MVQNAEALPTHDMPVVTCYRWPEKPLYMTKDAGELALAELLLERHGPAWREKTGLTVAPCGDHYHITCFRWYDKWFFWTADEASLMLRQIYIDRDELGRRPIDGLSVYPCFDHFHHGKVPIREGTMLHPSERRPRRRTRRPWTRPGGRVSPGRAQ